MAKEKNIKSSATREAIAYLFGVIGALTISYVSFFNHNISVWIVFLGVCFSLIGVAIYAQGKITSIRLYFSLFAIMIIALIITFALQTSETGNTDNNIQPDSKQKDSLVALLTDSIQKSRSYMAVVESIKTISYNKLETAQKYFQIENSPSIQAEHLSVDIKPSKKIICTIILANYGKTIAKNILSSNYYVYHTIDSFNKFTLNDKRMLKIQDLHPKQQKTLVTEMEKEIDQRYHDLLVSKKLFLYNYGRIIYQDISQKKYTYDYCSVYNFEKGLFFEIPDPIFSYEIAK